MSPRRRPRDTMIAAARALCADGLEVAALREQLIAAHGLATANALVARLRATGELAPHAAKLTSLRIEPSPRVRERLRRLADNRGVSHHRLAHLALVAGLAAMERRL